MKRVFSAAPLRKAPGRAVRASAKAPFAALLSTALLLAVLMGRPRLLATDQLTRAAAPAGTNGVGWSSASIASSPGVDRPRLILAWKAELTVAAREAGPSLSLESLVERVGGRAALEAARALLPDLEERLRRGPWISPNTQVLELPGGLDPREAMPLFRRLGAFRLVEPDEGVRAALVPDDPLFPRQWHLPRIGAEDAWEETTGDPQTVVAVVDTGIDASHPDLDGKVLAGRDFVNEDDDPADDHGHGTRVAGIIAACGGNGRGVAGVAWKARLLPVKVLDEKGCGHYSEVIAGIRYAADRGAEVINLSLSGGAASQALQEAVDYARSRGAVVVAAAGNEALDTLGWPAACRGALAVGALDREGLPAPFSNRGEGMGLAAPGVGILTTAPGGAYEAINGTSAAAPQVSGAAALLFSKSPQIRADEVVERLTGTALDLGDAGWDPATGLGLLQVHRALGRVDPPSTTEETNVLYFAEGYTGPGFDTFILWENPSEEAARAVLRLYGPHGPSSSLDVEVPSRSRRTLHLNRLMVDMEVSCSMELPPGSPLRVQRSMYFRYGHIGGGHTSMPLTPSREWHFAEGYTGEGFDTWLLLFNPNEAQAEVLVCFVAADGERRVAFILPPLARRSVLADDLVPGREVAVSVTSSQPVLAERSMYFDWGGRAGGTASGGIPFPSREWHFAEGYTGEGFDTWLLLFNPSSTEVITSVELLRSDGLALQEEVRLAPRSRLTLHLNDLPLLSAAEVSAKISASSPGLVAERAIYFRYRGPGGLEADGGHAAPGCVASDHAFLPEGYTGPGFDAWLLVANLEDREVMVGLAFYGESGRLVQTSRTLAPRSRLSLRVNDLLPGEGFCAEVSGPPGAALAVEGSLYFRYGGDIDDGSV